MMAEAPGPINFTMFLTMFGEKLNGTDPEEVIRNAFACFDDENSGKSNFFHHFCHHFLTPTRQTNYLYLGNINEDYLRELLTTMGDRFTDDQVDDMFREAPIDQKTCDFNYIEVRFRPFKLDGWKDCVPKKGNLAPNLFAVNHLK